MGWNLISRRSIDEPIQVPQAPWKGELDLEASTHSLSTKRSLTRTDELISELKSHLSRTGGCTKDPEVVAIVNELAGMNPCTKDCAKSPDFLGEFVALTCPNFPGRLKPQPGCEDDVQYTLGRLSFNIFQPAKLVCTTRSVRNRVAKVGTMEDGKRSQT